MRFSNNDGRSANAWIDAFESSSGVPNHAVFRFRRVVVLPAPVDPTTARASYRDGILEIRAAKAPRVSLEVAHVEVK
ncbi:MAG: Hsp20/alpha crystallin family protein [Armatimonadota bacterium]